MCRLSSSMCSKSASIARALRACSSQLGALVCAGQNAITRHLPASSFRFIACCVLFVGCRVPLLKYALYKITLPLGNRYILGMQTLAAIAIVCEPFESARKKPNELNPIYCSRTLATSMITRHILSRPLRVLAFGQRSQFFETRAPSALHKY